MPALKPTYILDNTYFVGNASDAKARLSTAYQLLALDKLKDELELNGTTGNTDLKTKPCDFRGHMCKNFKVIELWERLVKKKFGATATTSRALPRLVEHLVTDTGLKKVQSCWMSKIPLEGKSDNEVGILECRKLWDTFAKQLAGSLAPSATDKSSVSADQSGDPSLPPDQSADNARAELDALSGKDVQGNDIIAPEDEADMASAKLSCEAIDVLDIGDPKAVETRITEMARKKVIILIECPTSKKTVLVRFIDAAKQTEAHINRPENVKIITLMQSRVAMCSDALVLLNLSFPESMGWTSQIVTLARGTVQSRSVRPFFAFLTFNARVGRADAVPMQIPFTGGGQAECLRFRCKRGACNYPHPLGRAEDEIPKEDTDDADNLMSTALNDVGVDAGEDEDEGDACKADDAAAALLTAASGASESMDHGADDGLAAPRHSDIFPLTNSVNYYDAVFSRSRANNLNGRGRHTDYLWSPEQLVRSQENPSRSRRPYTSNEACAFSWPRYLPEANASRSVAHLEPRPKAVFVYQ